MSIWAKLQSWLGASASDVAIDNEFNNIYLGLNEAANGSRPSGYNDVRFTSSTNQLTIKGETKVGLLNVDLNSTITVSGLAGWRYVVSTNGGVVSVESIPPAEIVSDVIQYTPTPVFNSTLNGYYSTINPARRIIGIAYFDGTNLITIKPYGNSYKKNDDYWETNKFGIPATTAGTRLQFTDTWDKTWGNNIVCVDNGGAVLYDDTEGFRITFLKSGKAIIQVAITTTDAFIQLHKNALLYKTYLANNPSSPNAYMISIEGKVDANDYFTFVNRFNSLGSQINFFTIIFEEN